jgi:uncharacterized protein YjiS (DUF1127 family)
MNEFRSSPNQEIIVKTQKQTNPLTRYIVESGETLYEIAEASAVGTAHPDRNDQASISFRKVLHSLTVACRLCRERYRQRRQLLEMDDRELKDIGITREQAEQEGRKPRWKG